MRLFTLAIEAVSQCENHMNVILSRRRRISRFPAAYEDEILRLSPQDDIATQTNLGEGKVRVNNLSTEEEMATQKSKMICPKCGVEMNHHADKVVYPLSAQEAEIMDLVLGGVIEETHCCPGCGGVESRRAND